MMDRGTLFLIVGPSGAGKDSLIAKASAALRDDSSWVFPHRVITRPDDAVGENHVTTSSFEFEAMASAGSFCLHWGAHGLRYGVPASVSEDLAAGRNVVVNVSRGVVDDARARFAPVKVLSVTVPADILRARLLARGRESVEDVERRVARATAFSIGGPDLVEIANDHDLAAAERRFLEALHL